MIPGCDVKVGKHYFSVSFYVALAEFDNDQKKLDSRLELAKFTMLGLM